MLSLPLVLNRRSIFGCCMQLFKFQISRATVSDDDGPTKGVVKVKTTKSNYENTTLVVGKYKFNKINKFKPILVLFSEAFQKGRFPLFPFSTSTSKVHSKAIVREAKNLDPCWGLDNGYRAQCHC
jgi:hypothetical protein